MAVEIAPLDLTRFFERHPTLETERLILREVTVADAADLFAYFGDPETALYVSHPAHKAVEETEEVLSRSSNYLALHDSFRFAIERKSDKKAIGTIDLYSFSSEHHRMEIGYMLASAYWGFGYMTEAIREIIRFAFEEMSMHRIEAECETENIRSCKLAERCGMKLEATFVENEINKERFVSNHLYAIVRN
jgi:ribosomal-protein-alanine N-acetyltransferase